MVNAGHSFLAITMVLMCPMESFVAQHVVDWLLFDRSVDNPMDGPDGQIMAMECK